MTPTPNSRVLSAESSDGLGGPKPQAVTEPEYLPIVDDPALPRVLLIGDSISRGYTFPVRELLKGVANVHRPPVNCGPTIKGLAELDDWLGDGRWDVIHFNFGLHDLSHLDAEGRSAPPPIGKRQVTIEEYEKNLAVIVARLQKTGAVLIWCSSTPVPPGVQKCIAGDEVRYNAVAARIMTERKIAIHDLWSFANARLGELQKPANVHFTPYGSSVLAQSVAAAIRRHLPR